MANTSHNPQGTQQRTEGTTGRTAGEAKEKVQDLADRARTTAGNVADKAREAATGVKERTDDALSTVGQKMTSLASSLRESAPREGMMHTAAETGAEYLQAGGRYLQEHGLGDMGTDLTRLVRQYPMQSLLMSFGIGCLLGMTFRR